MAASEAQNMLNGAKDQVHQMGQNFKNAAAEPLKKHRPELANETFLDKGRELLQSEGKMAYDMARTGFKTVTSLIARNPLYSVLGALAIGVVAGAVIGQRGKKN